MAEGQSGECKSHGCLRVLRGVGRMDVAGKRMEAKIGGNAKI